MAGCTGLSGPLDGIRVLDLTTVQMGPWCTRILADIDEADLSVSLLQAAPRGRLRVNAPMSFSLSHLVPAIPEFLARFPDVEIDIAMNDRFVDLVDEGFDVGVRIGRLEDSSLVARTLAPARNAVCASPAYLERRGVPCSPQDLTQHDCLCYSNMTLADEWRFVMPDGRPLPVAVTGRLRVNNGDALRVACENGAGVAYLPTFITGEAIGAGRLIAFLEEYLPQDSAVHAVYPHQRLLSPKVRAFVDFLAERFGGRPYWDPVSPNSI